MRTQRPIDRLTIIFLLLLISTLYVALLTTPVGSTRDLYVDATITKPLIGNPSFTSITAYAQPHTLLSPPSFASILTSGTVVITLSTPSRSTQSNIGEIYRTATKGKRIILKSVPITENEVTVKLYENNVLIETQKVVIQ